MLLEFVLKTYLLIITKALYLEESKDTAEIITGMEKLNICEERKLESAESNKSKPSEVTVDPKEQYKKLFDEEYGFTYILDMLVEAKIPLVGHNMIFDVMFLYYQCIDDFPETYEEFRKSWHAHFPLTYDTKLLCSHAKGIKKTWLSEAYDQCLENEQLAGNLQFEYAPKFKMYDEEVQEHEAAYDAYMTGCIFATICKQAEIISEAKGAVVALQDYQQLLKLKDETEDKTEKEKVIWLYYFYRYTSK